MLKLMNISKSFNFQLTRSLSIKANGLEFKEITNKKSSLELTVIDNHDNLKVLSFNPHWLRFNCLLIKDKDAGQRHINAETVPFDLSIKSAKVLDNNILIKWHDGSNQKDSMLTIPFLINHYPEETYDKGYKSSSKPQYFDFSKFHDSNGNRNDSEILKWMTGMADFGVTILQNVGTKENTVRGVAELIAPVSKNLYGEEFDVKVEKNVTNIAYLDGPLTMHQDLPYYESPPGLQLLHCIKFDKEIVGGESLLLDAFTVAEDFKKEHPKHFKNLTTIPANFQYLIIGKQKQEVMITSKPHISVNHLGQINGIAWSTAQEGPLKNLSEDKIKAYYESYLTFSRFLKASPHLMTFRLEPGEVLIFNNRRMMHGRNGFSSMMGTRHFQGCYVNIDEFKSELLAQYVKQLMPENVGKKNFVDLSDVKLKRFNVGNNDFS